MSKNPFEGVQLVTPNSPKQNTEEKTTENKESQTTTTTETPPVGVIDLSGLEDERPFLEKVRSEQESTELVSETPAPVESNTEEDTVYSALVKELVDKGILEVPEDFKVESSDDLASLFDQTLNSRLEDNVNGFVQNFSGAKKMFLEIEDAFDDELVAMRVARDIDYFEQITPEVLRQQESVQKDILGRYLKLKGMSPAEVNEAIQEAETLAKLEEKASAALPQLKQSAKQYVEQKRKDKTEREQRVQKQHEEDFKSLINSVDSLSEILPGVELTTKHKSAIKKAMSSVSHTDPETGAQFTELGFKQYSNPKGFERLIQFYNVLGLFNTDKEGNFQPDMNKLVKLTEKQVKRKLDELIREQQQTSIPGQKSSAGTKLNISFWEDAFGND